MKTSINENKKNGSKGVKEKDNVALALKDPSGGQVLQEEKKKKKDLSKVKCFKCGEFGHYSTQCPQRNKDNQDQAITSAKIDKLSSRMEEYFTMFATIPQE